MPRKPRQISPSGVYHFMVRGVNKKKIFHSKNDCEAYLGFVKQYSEMYDIQVYHYCIMENHAHFILRATELRLLSKLAHSVQRRYAYYYCKRYAWSEQVFRRNFASIPIDTDSYLLECGRYIERNPVDAKIVSEVGDYLYSSYLFYAEGKPNALLTESPAYLALSDRRSHRQTIYRAYVTIEREQIATIIS
ncbi:MAG: hypothetical protein MOGMAGMI_02110 [Candidatus Omnitrophica bacterium]|nr:hypothetical protein [Candidatus Omnitrophota bacterium]